MYEKDGNPFPQNNIYVSEFMPMSHFLRPMTHTPMLPVSLLCEVEIPKNKSLKNIRKRHKGEALEVERGEKNSAELVKKVI